MANYDVMDREFDGDNPYPGMPRYVGDYLDRYLRRPWAWSKPMLGKRRREAEQKIARVVRFADALKKRDPL